MNIPGKIHSANPTLDEDGGVRQIDYYYDLILGKDKFADKLPAIHARCRWDKENEL